MSKRKKIAASAPIQMREDAPEPVIVVSVDTSEKGDTLILPAPDADISLVSPIVDALTPDAPPAAVETPAPVVPVSLASLFPSRFTTTGTTTTGRKGRPKTDNLLAIAGLSIPNAIAVRSIADDLAAHRTFTFDNGMTYLVADQGLTTRWNHTTPLSVSHAEKGRQNPAASNRTYLGIIDAIEHVEGDASRRALRLASDAIARVERFMTIREMTAVERAAVRSYYAKTYSTSNLHDAREDDAAPRRCDKMLSLGEIRAAVARSTLTA